MYLSAVGRIDIGNRLPIFPNVDNHPTYTSQNDQALLPAMPTQQGALMVDLVKIELEE